MCRVIYVVLHPTPYTLHPTPYTLQAISVFAFLLLRPAAEDWPGLAFGRNLGAAAATSCRSLHPTPCTLHPAPCTLHNQTTPHTLHPVPHTLLPAPYTLHLRLQNQVVREEKFATALILMKKKSQYLNSARAFKVSLSFFSLSLSLRPSLPPSLTPSLPLQIISPSISRSSAARSSMRVGSLPSLRSLRRGQRSLSRRMLRGLPFARCQYAQPRLRARLRARPEGRQPVAALARPPLVPWP